MKPLLKYFFDFFLDFSITAGPTLQLLYSKPEPQVFMTVFLFHVLKKLLKIKKKVQALL